MNFPFPAKFVAFDDPTWRALDVPHDWSNEGDYAKTNSIGNQCVYLPSGTGWCRRVIEMPSAWQGKEVTLEFEGVHANSGVWLNRQPDGKPACQ